MREDAELCPYCGRTVDVERAEFVGDGLVACEHCGEIFNRTPVITAEDTIGTRYGDRPPAAIRILPEDAPAHQPAAPLSKARSTPSPRHGRLATWAWTLGILLLLSLLMIQAAWFMRDELARHTPLRPLLTQFCDYAGCEIPLLRAPGQIRVVARDIRRHPEAGDALRVSITFANDAAFSQAWPDLQLSFFDMRDQVLARRRFTPAEYLPENIDMSSGMPANGALQTVIEVIDPGADAVNFTFEFM